ncbi:MAG TPA: asparagine synthase (glutamine-hydrolyzing) [Methylomirabilota bacterium]|nr:asparagine synthase (glutamine-hydrolyzing) [Methylomirabilota bacterium]
MCGIAGFWCPDRGTPTAHLSALTRMTRALAHRGPDAEGHWLDSEFGVALGHRRLSIIDLSPTGTQPMRSASGRFTIIFNGEIYNFRRLRQELMAMGAAFQGSSDTEVLLAAFEQWGVASTIPRTSGMFALAVWDAKTHSLWLARDRMGEKPLYVAQFNGQLAFASELKAFHTLRDFPADIEPAAMWDLMRNGYIGGRHTIYRAVSRLLPGELAVVALGDGVPVIRTQRYWSLHDHLRPRANDRFASDESATDALDTLLREVVRDEMVADVPVGAFLSGGIDSSLIVALMQAVATRPVRTFTIGFRENTHDESPYARDVAKHLGTDHTEIILSADDALAFVERLPQVFDEPFADSSQLPTLLVSSVTRRHVTVALSGDGGDELFGGYSQYVTRDSIGQLVDRVPRMLCRPLGAALRATPRPLLTALLARGSTWAPNTRARLVRELQRPSRAWSYESLLAGWVEPADILSATHARQAARRESPRWPDARTDVEARMAFDMEHYLPDDILVKVDRSSMACSLETRAPLLDHRVVEFALSQPLHHKIRDRRGKFLLRNLLARYVPLALVDRPKRGFAVPLAAWLRGALKSWGDTMLKPDALLQIWFQPAAVGAAWRAHQRGENHAERLWPVLIAMQWLRSTTRSSP